MSQTLPRPRQVTMAAWMVIIGSVLVVLFVADMIARLGSLETRESVEQFLTESGGLEGTLTVSGALSIMRVLGMVAAGCATAGAILGWSVLKGNRAARLGLTVLALPLLVSGMVSGGFMSTMVAVASLMLWMQPARDWFDGKPAPKPESQRSAPSGGDAFFRNAPQSTSTHHHAAPSAGPRPVVGFGDAGQVASVTSAGVQQPTSSAMPAPMRPPTVVWACVLTWFFSVAGALVISSAALLLSMDSAPLLAEVRAQNPQFNDPEMTDQVLLSAVYLTVAGLVVWALGAIVLAVLVWRGVSWARIVLMVSTGGAMAFLGLAAAAQPLMVLPFAAACVTFALLARRESAAWANGIRR